MMTPFSHQLFQSKLESPLIFSPFSPIEAFLFSPLSGTLTLGFVGGSSLQAPHPLRIRLNKVKLGAALYGVRYSSDVDSPQSSRRSDIEPSFPFFTEK